MSKEAPKSSNNNKARSSPKPAASPASGAGVSKPPAGASSGQSSGGRGRGQGKGGKGPAAGGVGRGGKNAGPSSSQGGSPGSSHNDQRPDPFRIKFKKDFDALENIQKEQTQLKARKIEIHAQVDTLRNQIQQSRAGKNPLRDALKEVGEKRRKIAEANKLAKHRQEEIRKQLTQRKAALDARAEPLPFRNWRDPEFAKKNYDEIAADVKVLEQKIVEQRLSSAEEKKTLSKINDLERKKTIVRECEQMRLVIESARGPRRSSPAPTAASSSEGSAPASASSPSPPAEDDEWKQLSTRETEIKGQLDGLNAQIKKTEDKIAGLLKELDTIRDKTKVLSEQWTVQQKLLSTKREEEKEARRVREEKLKEERAARLAQRKQEQEERARQEALRLPYENELMVAKGLIPHLASVKGKGDKLTLPLRVYNSFEILSIPPPLNPSEVSGCLAKVNEKIAFYKAARKAEKEKRAVAEKQRIESEAAGQAAPAVAPTPSSSSSSEPENAQPAATVSTSAASEETVDE